MKLRRVPYQAGVHFDYMSTSNEGGVPPALAPDNVYELHFRGEVLVFMNREQVSQARDYLAAKLRPSGRGQNPPHEHYWHRWYARLPKNIAKGSNRDSLVKALESGLRSL